MTQQMKDSIARSIRSFSLPDFEQIAYLIFITVAHKVYLDKCFQALREEQE